MHIFYEHLYEHRYEPLCEHLYEHLCEHIHDHVYALHADIVAPPLALMEVFIKVFLKETRKSCYIILTHVGRTLGQIYKK